MTTQDQSRRAAGEAKRSRLGRAWAVLVFLGPAMLVVGALLVYPIVFTLIRSMFSANGTAFVGLRNYEQIFAEPRTLIALRNNVIWVVFAPANVTFLGLVFAVMSERLTWVRAFRMSLFLPLVVSGLAAGVTFRFIYAKDPGAGVLNAVISTVVEAFHPPGQYTGARPSQPDALVEAVGGYRLKASVRPGDTTRLGLVGFPPTRLPSSATPAKTPSLAPHTIAGTVWLDFSPGGTKGVIDASERGMPGMLVDLNDDLGDMVGKTKTAADGTFAFKDVKPGTYHLSLAPSNFRVPFGGIPWLGPLLITPAIIVGYLWIHTGFALLIIGAGLTALNRELQESARIDGATEWQVFRHITIPLLRPVLLVIFVTTTISVLKIFDLVLVIAPESVQYNANVLALEMWRASFGGANDFGTGSALAILLFLLIIPAMAFNIRRFRLGET